KVVFADVTPETLTLDPMDVERKIGKRTRAIMPVIYAGVSPDLAALGNLANDQLDMVEDAAQGVGAKYRGRPAGTSGSIGCFSFHETKNLSTGEGGAFVTAHPEYMKRAEVIREKGTNRQQFLQGLVDRYTWVDIGSSYLPPDFIGALLVAQIEKLEKIIQAREAIYQRYIKELAPLEKRGLIRLPTIPPEVKSNFHL